MASLLSERDSLELRLESAVRLQSPVHRLPSELLASIFTTCIMSMEEEDTLMLSTIMLVSRHWKEVALNTSILWSRIVAGTHHPLAKTFRKLERSKSIPLHICVDFSPRVENGTVTTESIVRTMDLLRTSVWRWKTFRLTVPNRPQAHAALTRCKESAPLLEVLSIHVLHSMQEDVYHTNPPRTIFEGQTPSLTYCSMTSFNFGWDMHLLSRLRVLKLGGYWNGYAPSMDTTLSILRACPHLEELVLRNMSDIDSGSCPGFDTDPSEYDDASARVTDTHMIHLPRLVTASFYYSGAIRTRTILSLLSCPALESVDLCFLDNVSPMIEHLRRQSLTFLPLRRLRIESCFFSELKLARFLRRVPSLTTLELVDVEDASSSLLKVCTPSHGHSPRYLMIVYAEPRHAPDCADLGLPEAHHAKSRGLHHARLGGHPLRRRVPPATQLPRLLAADLVDELVSAGVLVRVIVCVERRPAPAHCDVVRLRVRRDGAHLGAHTRHVPPEGRHFWVTAAVAVDGSDQVSSNQQGDGPVVTVVRQRGEVRQRERRVGRFYYLVSCPFLLICLMVNIVLSYERMYK